MRVALGYALVYALLAGSALGAFYWATSRYVDAQLDAGLREDFQSLRDRYQRSGLTGLQALMQARLESGITEGRFYLLADRDGVKLAGNLTGWPPEDPLPLTGEVQVVWVEDDIIPDPSYRDDAYWPVIGTEFPDGTRLVVARSIQQAEELHVYSLYALYTLLGVLVLLALTMGLLMGNSLLQRIDRITATAQRIMSGDLGQRMPVSARCDEFDSLSERLNEMLDRIEQLIQGMRTVTDNVAHDLRTPLNRLRNRLEVTLLEPRDTTEYRQAMESAISDAEQLLRTFNAILQISQADAGTVRAGMDTLDLARLAREITDLYRPAAEDAGLDLEVAAEEPVPVTGNRHLLGQALGNLLDNAVKYTPRGGSIHVSAHWEGDHAELTVSDTGPGVAPDARERVLRRFVRLEGARETPGNGLGLSLVDAIARQHGAVLELRSNAPGLRATLRFSGRPKAAAARS